MEVVLFEYVNKIYVATCTFAIKRSCFHVSVVYMHAKSVLFYCVHRKKATFSKGKERKNRKRNFREKERKV